MNLKTFTKGQEFITTTVKKITDLLEQKPGTLYIALSGGKTPTPVYEALANNPDVDFNRIEWFVVDERYVPFDHLYSNYKMITKAFAKAGSLFQKHLHWFNTQPPAKVSAERYEEELKKIPNQEFDVVILGIGNDGHTASLFPGSPTLKERKHLAVHTINESAPNPPVAGRLTITWPVIMKSGEVVLLVSGKEKQEIMNELLHGKATASVLPAKKLLEHPNFTVHFLVGA